MHLLTGKLGHLMVIIALISAIVATISYFLAAGNKNTTAQSGWMKNGRIAFYIHALSVLGVIVFLYVIIGNNYFEYHYAWSHSSRYLPFYYKISAFWEGQEGSFLLWIFWHVIIGLIIIKTSRKWEGPVMFIFSFVQSFLVSMILGVVLFNLKFGSSPFILLREMMTDAPVFAMNPDFIPEDGNGLNPLLQNYWMVIHPPTLFLGFALTIVPFSYAMAGLWYKKFREWIKPAMPWTIVTSAILGLGILMGAYWAYETLNFGGYWNWDPVENAIYVPWLIIIASLHSMIIFKKNNSSLKLTFILVISGFLLILYSTFLTRSGILGESSVHSFTDLGLSGQLLIYLGVFFLVSLFFLVKNWGKIPSTSQDLSTYSSEFWIFTGAIVLCLAGFQVIVPTSIPVINAVGKWFGLDLSLAPPPDQMLFYSRFQIWFAIGITVLSGTAQIFWWKKLNKKNLFGEIALPVVVSLLGSTLIMIFIPVGNPAYIFLIASGIYSITSNGRVLYKIVTKKFSFSGGAIAHAGVALMLLGILFSSGYSRTVSLNNTGMVYSKEFPDEINKENLLLFIDESRQMGAYRLTYKGKRLKAEGIHAWIKTNEVINTNDPRLYILANDIQSGRKTFHKGDTVEINPENTYFEVMYESTSGQKFYLYPRLQENPKMGNVVSPSIRRGIVSDMYTHVTVVAEDEKTWSEPVENEIRQGDRFFINDFVAEFQGIEKVENFEGITLAGNDIGVKARIILAGNDQTYPLSPMYIIRGNMAASVPDEINELGVRIVIERINPASDSFTMKISTAQKDYIILKAVEKPLINILWTGTFLVLIGFCVASIRRFRELRSAELKDTL